MRAIYFCDGLTFTSKLIEGARMLADLVDAHNEYVMQLSKAIETDSDQEQIVNLDRGIRLFADSIRDLHLAAPAEINQQIKFFLNRSEMLGDDTISASDRQTVSMLIDRYTNQTSPALHSRSTDSMIESQVSMRLKDEQFVADRLIEQSDQRISLYNLDYKYEYTSRGNAQFHNASPDDFMGLHVVNIVGDRRFEKRAKRYYDRCFAGEHVGYSYFLDVPDLGERLMDCSLTPYRDSDGCVRGAYFTVEDITARMEQATASAKQHIVA